MLEAVGLFKLTHRWVCCIGLSLVAMVGIGDISLSCIDGRPFALTRLQGQSYSELPPELCQGYADTVFGTVGDVEYGGVICDRANQSYLLLQRLVGYTAQRKAIWKVLHIYHLSALQPQESTISVGCEHLHNHETLIVAVVKASKAPNLQVIKAWEVDLNQERLSPIQPQVINCGPPFLQQQL